MRPILYANMHPILYYIYRFMVCSIHYTHILERLARRQYALYTIHIQTQKYALYILWYHIDYIVYIVRIYIDIYYMVPYRYILYMVPYRYILYGTI